MTIPSIVGKVVIGVLIAKSVVGIAVVGAVLAAKVANDRSTKD